MASHVFKCATCGVVTTEQGHLCNPQPVKDDCSYCGKPVEDARHMCKPMRESLEFVCESCGRPASRAELVCHPKKMPD